MQEFEFQINYDEKSYTLRKYKGDASSRIRSLILENSSLTDAVILSI